MVVFLQMLTHTGREAVALAGPGSAVFSYVATALFLYSAVRTLSRSSFLTRIRRHGFG